MNISLSPELRFEIEPISIRRPLNLAECGLLCHVLGVGVEKAILVEQFQRVSLIQVVPHENKDPLIPVIFGIRGEFERRYRDTMQRAMSSYIPSRNRAEEIGNLVDWILNFHSPLSESENAYLVAWLCQFQNTLYCSG